VEIDTKAREIGRINKNNEELDASVAESKWGQSK
jgi:hypothetical protein